MSTNHSPLTKVKNSKIWLGVTALFGALLASSCCLPALAFLLFGSSFGFLSVFEPLYKFRWILTVISILCFILFVKFRYFTSCKDESCEMKTVSKGEIFSVIILGISLVFILFYPEILGALYEIFS